ncbi:MAG: hypothetical protein AAF581_19100 [Planctomycetota bacterium]
MKPVLQYPHLADLEGAAIHLEQHGHASKITSFNELPETAQAAWMTPEKGGYILYLHDDENYDAAMTCLGSFFGRAE